MPGCRCSEGGRGYVVGVALKRALRFGGIRPCTNEIPQVGTNPGPLHENPAMVDRTQVVVSEKRVEDLQRFARPFVPSQKTCQENATRRLRVAVHRRGSNQAERLQVLISRRCPHRSHEGPPPVWALVRSFRVRYRIVSAGEQLQVAETSLRA